MKTNYIDTLDKETLESLYKVIWNVLQGAPINIIDDENVDDNYVWENPLWELASNRNDATTYDRAIGSGNMVVAVTLLKQKLIKDDKTAIVMDLFHEILEQLQKDHLIRKIPKKVRETFKIV